MRVSIDWAIKTDHFNGREPRWLIADSALQTPTHQDRMVADRKKMEDDFLDFFECYELLFFLGANFV